MRSFPLTVVTVALALSCFDPASADDESYGRRMARSDHEEQFRDGNCRVKVKWEKDGDYKEERECKRVYGRRVAERDFEEEFRDGNCKIKRKWEKDGDFKEEIECKGARRGPAAFYARPDERVWTDPGRAPVLVPRGDGLFCNRELLGSAIGAAAGGLLGNQVGRGDGRTAATIGGALIGVLVGGSIGRSMDRADHECVSHTLEGAEANRIVSWQNPDGRAYEVKPVRSFQDGAGRQCREYVTTARIDGRLQQAYGTACRQPDGSWQLVG
jgi:surface antigen